MSHYPLLDVSDTDKYEWKSCNSHFSENISRKSNVLMGNKSDKFQDLVVEKYIQIDCFLEQLRIDHPDLYNIIENIAIAQLDSIKTQSVFENHDLEFTKSIVENNRKAFDKHSSLMSAKNMESLSFGYLSKWLAECFMDFDS